MHFKKKILWIIDSLGRGGAETLLVDLLPSLKNDFDIYLVSLSKKNDFDLTVIQNSVKSLIRLDLKNKFDLFKLYFQLKDIKKKINPDIIRSELTYSNILTRIISNRNDKYIFTVHSILSKDSFAKNKYMLLIEKLLYKKHHHLIAVSNQVLFDFNIHIGVKGKASVLHNYVSNKFFENKKTVSINNIRRIVCVGNLKAVKNYQYIINVFKVNPIFSAYFTLDIYGDGPLKQSLYEEIIKYNLPINLKGKSNKIHKILKDYDAFLLPSLHEGFGIAVAEAMATGLPLILSDLEVLRSTSNGYAQFFNPVDPLSLENTLMKIMNFDNKTNIQINNDVKRAQDFATNNYSKNKYVAQLLEIYQI